VQALLKGEADKATGLDADPWKGLLGEEENDQENDGDSRDD